MAEINFFFVLRKNDSFWLTQTNMIDVQTKTQAKIDTLRLGVTGGAPASPDLFKRINESLNLENMKV